MRTARYRTAIRARALMRRINAAVQHVSQRRQQVALSQVVPAARPITASLDVDGGHRRMAQPGRRFSMSRIFSTWLRFHSS